MHHLFSPAPNVQSVARGLLSHERAADRSLQLWILSTPALVLLGTWRNREGSAGVAAEGSGVRGMLR